MDDREFDRLARQAFAVEEAPNERVWRQVRPEPKWLPSFREIAFATAVGAGVLLMLGHSTPQAAPLVAKETPPPKAGPDRTYVAINAMMFP